MYYHSQTCVSEVEVHPDTEENISVANVIIAVSGMCPAGASSPDIVSVISCRKKGEDSGREMNRNKCARGFCV